MPLYLEDLAPGQTWRSTEAIRVDADMIRDFAASYDPQPFHLDAEAASHSLFGQMVASGWHTAALTMRLFVATVPLAGGIVGAGVEGLRWPRPVRPGDVLSLKAELLSATPSRSRSDRGAVRMAVTTLAQGEDVVQELTPTLIVLRKAMA